jgi:hypothetical protein
MFALVHSSFHWRTKVSSLYGLLLYPVPFDVLGQIHCIVTVVALGGTVQGIKFCSTACDVAGSQHCFTCIWEQVHLHYFFFIFRCSPVSCLSPPMQISPS